MGGCGIGRFDLRSPVFSSQWMDVRTSLCVPLAVRQRDALSLAAARPRDPISYYIIHASGSRVAAFDLPSQSGGGVAARGLISHSGVSLPTHTCVFTRSHLLGIGFVYSDTT